MTATCCYCGSPFSKRKKRTDEHIIPKSRGGVDNRYNIADACAPCNRLRGNSMPDGLLRRAALARDKIDGHLVNIANHQKLIERYFEKIEKAQAVIDALMVAARRNQRRADKLEMIAERLDALLTERDPIKSERV